ncbi:glycosyltransferase [Actinomyces naeslundii]|uniref:glycosyltransferase n=1 Tax=Actinomyces naeslundii TaxID=1655 RepID=UPI00096D0D75|nr:glycosyltransferase [Actinomyces naeslundii]OMG18886.1 glycosyltransferase [Actinomyces naeslundii]
MCWYAGGERPVAATAVYLDLKTLTSLADSAAAAGAQSMDAHPYYGDGTDTAPGALTDAEVRSHAAADVSAQPAAARLTGITVSSARAADSQTAVVTLQARSRPPFLPWGIIPAEGFTITATGSARMTTTQ